MADEPTPPPRRARALPARIGRYRIDNIVGRGAMGVVYSAYDEAMGRPVAVKVLMGDLESDPEVRKRFYREAQAAAGLLHANIITIYDAGEDQGRSYIAMQLLEGAPLSTYLKQEEAITLERKLELMVQICEGLGAAHARGIVHRDLKPGKLFVQADGVLKILDFGVARLADSSMTATGMMLGTPDYMSPEQARGTSVDARSDIFSLGAVFYFMLAGRKPFPGPDLPAVLRQLQSDEPSPLEPAVPPELARLVVQAMAKDPAGRPQRVQDLHAGIVRFRRQLEAGTRKLTRDAAARYDAVLSGIDGLRRAGDALDLPPDAEPPLLASVREQYPSVAKRGGAALETAVFDRLRVERLVADLDAEAARLDGEVGRRGRAADMLAEGERALKAGDARTAFRLFGQLHAEFPGSGRVTSFWEQSSAAVRELDARDARVRELLAAAFAAFDAHNWMAAKEGCESALALVPALPAASTLLREVQQAIDEEGRQRARQIQQALERARAAIEAQRFDDAETSLAEAETLDPAAAVAMRRTLVEAREAAAEAARIRQLSAEEIRRARSVFRRGGYEEALAALGAFAADHPGSTETADEVARLTALHRRLSDAAVSRRQEVTALIDAARAAAGDGRFDEAIAAAAAAVRCDPAAGEASAALDEMMTRDLETRLERERMRADERRGAVAAAMIASAREAQARGYLGVALEAALGAARVAPGQAEIDACVTELRGLVASEDETVSDLRDSPFPALRLDDAPPARSKPPGPDDRSPDGGAISQVNRWASDLLRRRTPNR